MTNNMSFSLATAQVRHRTKTVTRRKGWRDLTPGTLINACVKCMGLRSGQKVERICQIRVTAVRREPLRAILAERRPASTACEGFSDLTPQQFIDLFCQHMGGDPEQEITRIEFKYV